MDNPPCVFLSPPLTPHRAHWARGCSGESGLAAKLPSLGNGPRGSPVSYTFLLAGRTACFKGQLGFTTTLALFVTNKSKVCLNLLVGYECRKIRQVLPKLPNPRYPTSAPTQAAAKQSGDRQRREKGPPILTAEKGEHERAPRAGESCPTPLRATLRAPPSKWAIEAFFP